MLVREEKPEDYATVYEVVAEAFGTADEAELVVKLRAVEPHISLVAEAGGEVVGHIFFSPVTAGDFVAMGLAPMAVRPDWQRRGVGSRLAEAGLAECRRLGYDVVFVLGHPEYYPRFGFVVASKHGFSCEYDAPDEAFMVAELTAGALAGRSGVVRYGPEFAAD
jgi:putative acetyltransferase